MRYVATADEYPVLGAPQQQNRNQTPLVSAARNAGSRRRAAKSTPRRSLFCLTPTYEPAQLAATGNCVNPVRLRGRVDAIDCATGEVASLYDTASEPGGVLRLPCGNRREDICAPCSGVYKGDARRCPPRP
jgi:hypothetical protein